MKQGTETMTGRGGGAQTERTGRAWEDQDGKVRTEGVGKEGKDTLI